MSTDTNQQTEIPAINNWCRDNGIAPAHLTAVMLIVEDLSDEELATQNLAAALGSDPRPLQGWEKIQPLYTIPGPEGVPYLRREEAIMLSMLAQNRLARRREKDGDS